MKKKQKKNKYTWYTPGVHDNNAYVRTYGTWQSNNKYAYIYIYYFIYINKLLLPARMYTDIIGDNDGCMMTHGSSLRGSPASHSSKRAPASILGGRETYPGNNSFRS